MYCKMCGTKLSDDAIFCSKCGAQLADGESVEHGEKEPVVQEQPVADPLEQPAPVVYQQSAVAPAPSNGDIGEIIPLEKSGKKEKVITRCLLAGIILGTIGAAGFLLIVLSGVIFYNRIYLFDGYESTKYLTTTCIVLMLIGLCSVIAKAVLNLKFKIGKFPANVVKRILLVILAASCLGFSVWGFVECSERNGWGGDTPATGYRLESAYNSVRARYGSSPCYSLAFDGSYIMVDTNPYDVDDYYNATYVSILKAVNDALGLPDYIYQSMIRTTAAMGKQTSTANGITVSWTYHPDRGLEAMYIKS